MQPKSKYARIDEQFVPIEDQMILAPIPPIEKAERRKGVAIWQYKKRGEGRRLDRISSPIFHSQENDPTPNVTISIDEKPLPPDKRHRRAWKIVVFGFENNSFLKGKVQLSAENEIR